MKNMISNKGSITEAILKASRKLAAIITVMAVIGFSFAACGEKDEDSGDDDISSGLPSAGDGSINLSIPKTYAVENANGISITFTTFNGHKGWELIDCFNNGEYEVKLENETLSIKLGTPKTDKLYNASERFNTASTTEGLKIFEIRGFYTEDYLLGWGYDKEDEINQHYESESISFVYADKPGKITHYKTYNDDGWTGFVKLDMDLKSGWNTVIGNGMGDEKKKEYNEALISGKPQTKHKWRLQNRNE